MGFEDLQNINEEKFTVESSIIERIPNLLIKGSIDLADPGVVLNPLFDEFHNAVLERGSREVHVDIGGLDYINSSGIKSIIKFVMKILTTQPDKQYRVIISYNSEKEWQQSSFKPVTLLAPKIVIISPKKEKSTFS